MKIQSLYRYRINARKKLPKFLYEYIDGGSYYEQTLSRNSQDLKDISIRQRILHDVSSLNLKTRIFDSDWSMPVGLGPVGLAGLFSRRGEISAAMASENKVVPFCLSALSICSLEEIHEHVVNPTWFQIYMIKDRGYMKNLIARADKLGCKAMILTVDMPVPALRYRDFQTGLSGDSRITGQIKRLSQALLKPGWLYHVGMRGRPHVFGNISSANEGRSSMDDCVKWISENFDASITWRDVEWLRHNWQGQLIVKGILDAEDALIACKAGVDGIIVSNHGGRQMDGTVSTARSLASIIDVLDNTIPVLVDGGVRSGIDVIKMLAVGARGVMLGRLWAYALASGGRKGVEDMLTTVRNELEATMAMAGCNDVSDIDRNLVNID